MIRKRTAAVLDALPRNETFDWVERVSVDLTNMMLATLFDFPWADRQRLTWWSDVAIANVNSPDAVVHSEDERFAELTKMGEYFRTLWDARANAAPAFDLISMLAHAEATRNMPPREFIGTLALLIVGGNDTTRNSMSGGLMALVENPEQFELVRSRHELIPNLVSEIIRYQTPVLHMRRTARNDVELAGRRIATGDKVVMWYISGNRDEDKIERADEFIIDRVKPRQHLRSALASIAVSATGSPSSNCGFSGKKSCAGICVSRSWARRDGCIRILSAAFELCRSESSPSTIRSWAYATRSSSALKSARARCASRLRGLGGLAEAEIAVDQAGAVIIFRRDAGGVQAHRHRPCPRRAADRTTPCRRSPARARQGFWRAAAKRASRRRGLASAR